MHTAPMAPSAPATVAMIDARAIESVQLALRAERRHGYEDADQEVGDADAEQRLERVAQLRLSLVEQRAVGAPRQHGSDDEYHPSHGVHGPRVSERLHR